MNDKITLKDIIEADRRIRRHVVRTPLIHSVPLSRKLRRNVFLKLEIAQPTGSFKLRGAANAIIAAVEAGARDVICCSTGNHGRAVAYMAQRLGIRATVCMPRTMSPYKCKRIEEFGAIVRTIGETQDDVQAEVDQIVANGLMVEIAPFDDKAIVCGQGTVGLEILDERPDIRTIIAPLSGGGLIGGTGIVAKAFDTSIFVVGATLEHGAAMAESIRSGRPARVQEQPTIADALSGGIGENNKWTLKLCKELVDEIIQVPDAAIPEAMRRLFDEHRLVTEGAGAIAVAALDAMQQKDGDVAVILSGNNIDSDEFFSFVRHL